MNRIAFLTNRVWLNAFLPILVVLNFWPSSAAFAQIFTDDFESGQFKPQWTAVANVSGSNGYVGVTTGTPHDGQYAAWLGKTSDAGGLTTNALDLRLNLQGQTAVEMTFWIYDNNDVTHAEDGIYFSNNNGASFKKVLDFKPSDWCDYAWGSFPPIEIHKLAAQVGLTLNSQFVIRFQQRGEFDFNGSPDGIGLDDVNVYVPCTAYFPLSVNNPFCEDFESGKLECNWANRFAGATATLAATPTRPSNFAEPVSNTAFAGQYSLAMGKTCDDGFATNAVDLHLNLQGLTKVELTFWIYDNNDETQIDDGIYFSDNGGLTFKKVFDFRPSDWCDYRYGRFPPLEIHKLAAQAGLTLSSQFVIRFQQHDDADFSGSPDGIFLDDICVYVPCTTYFPLTANNPFYDGFETGKLECHWAQRFSNATNTLASVPNRPSNYADVTPNTAAAGQYSLALGKTCDDGFATNAVDLHLNMQGLSKVEMLFNIYDNNDETQADDGIYFSDNAGLTFKKISDFRPSDWCDYEYGEYPPFELHKLVAAVGLAFTSQCIIRFQQHDDADFSGTPDGLFFDEVRVYVPVLEYASIPFSESFETGDLQPMWAKRFAGQTALPSLNVTRPTNYIGLETNPVHSGQYAVAMGKICDDGFATNALDLHLNLAGTSNVKMSFWINVWAEETQIQDGIWFSNNGGLNFTKVYSFNFDNNQDYTYYKLELNVTDLALTAGVPPSDKFIIRFQQHDDTDFSGTPDGILLDDIDVTGTVSTSDAPGQLRPTLYPNPVSEMLYLKGFEDIEMACQILDVRGAVVKNVRLAPDSVLDVRSLEAGLYFIHGYLDGHVWQSKFVKE